MRYGAHQLCQAGYEGGRTVECFNSPEIGDAEGLCFLFVLDVYFIERFDMIGNERKWHHEELFMPGSCQFCNCGLRRRFQPLDRPGAGLEGKVVRDPAEMCHSQAHRCFDVVEVGITGIDE